MTAIELIQQALAKARVLGTGDILSDEDAKLSLDTLNLMLDSWSLDRLFVFVETSQVVNTTGQQSYTIGPGGDFDVPRPNALITAYAQVNEASYPITILDNPQQYDNIQIKGVGMSWPQAVWYEHSYPLGRLHFWPVSTGQVHLRFTAPLQEFDSLTEEVALPMGYKKAIVDSLAVELAQAFNTEISPLVLQSATNAIARLKRFNSKPATRNSDAAFMASRYQFGTFNILTDGY